MQRASGTGFSPHGGRWLARLWDAAAPSAIDRWRGGRGLLRLCGEGCGLRLSQRLRSLAVSAEPGNAGYGACDRAGQRRRGRVLRLPARRRELQIWLGRGRPEQDLPSLEPPMSGLTEAEKAACPAAARTVLVGYLAGEVSAEIALMHLLLATGALPPLQRCLQTLGATGRDAFLRLPQLAANHG